MLFLFPEREYKDRRLLPFTFKKRVPTIEELCSGKIGDVRKVLESNKRSRNDYGRTTKGYTRKKGMRHILDIPMEVLFHPELGKYFAKGMDPHERKKNRYDFLKKYPQFKTVDKL